MFYVVATPIGNLEDLTFRALRILKEVDFILCEDTRVTKKLLARYNIKMPTISYHQHSRLKKIDYILDLLGQGKNLALVSDAGTPAIADPGNKLVQKIIERFGSQVVITPIPGPSALTAAISVSGLPMGKFFFAGFPPTKTKRKKFFQEITDSKEPVIFYESPYRIKKTLNEIAFLSPKSRLVICNDLTKKFERIYRGTVDGAIKELAADNAFRPKGEFLVILEGKR